MSNNQRPHFWIPDNEVEQVSKTIRGDSKPRDIVHSEHGAKLSQGLQFVKQSLESIQDDDSLQDMGLYVFRVELPEGEKVQSRKDLFSSNGMKINAVKDERNAIVSTTKQQFQILKNRVNAYTIKGTNKTYFDYIENISPYVGTEKNASVLKKKVYIDRPPETVDIQLMFIPNLQAQEYEVAVAKVVEKITATNGVIQQQPYYLSDNTPVIRAIIPSSALMRYENDSAIYRIEETRFFSARVDSGPNSIPASVGINKDVDIGSLPIVAVLDSGVNFTTPFDQLLIDHWIAPGSTGGDCDHGTRVASKVAFAHLGVLLSGTDILTPRARIIDCNIMDGSVPENILIQRIQDAVALYSGMTKIFNLSANASAPIEGDEMSIIGFELDALMDLNGDSIDELITSQPGSGQGATSLQIFTIQDGERKLYASNISYICTGGILEECEEGQTDPGQYYAFYRCGATGPEFIEKIVRDPITLYWGRAQAGKDGKTVTEEEAMSLIKSYQQIELDWKPFIQYPLK